MHDASSHRLTLSHRSSSPPPDQACVPRLVVCSPSGGTSVRSASRREPCTWGCSRWSCGTNSPGSSGSNRALIYKAQQVFDVGIMVWDCCGLRLQFGLKNLTLDSHRSSLRLSKIWKWLGIGAVSDCQKSENGYGWDNYAVCSYNVN